MLKSPSISALSTLTNRSERKSANYFRKSVYGPGGLYTVARARDRADLFCISAVVGRQGQQGLLVWPYIKYNCVKNVFIYYLGIIFICVMSTKLSMISLVEGELEILHKKKSRPALQIVLPFC